jgi:hypothetical protein
MKVLIYALGFAAAFALSVTTDIEAQGGELVHGHKARCIGPFEEVDDFEEVNGNDAMDRYFCKDYLLNRELVIHTVQLHSSIVSSDIDAIGVIDQIALQNYLSNAGHLSSACSRERLRALICSETFPQCTNADGFEFTGVPVCKEFCTYVLGCTYDVEQCRSAPNFDIDDPEACAFYNPALIDSSSATFAVGLLSLLG